ncbi:uncharacterized protein LOC114252224, partial [Bombyx mandarina]|uniref:Uncharacterized protein LOC114252224 n=1 Tax=Bombyx mandarina TaxID=7092 RepID=A0A6J2KQW9_BOMMA
MGGADGSCSDTLTINAGVPQGSVPFPTLFILYINDMLPIDGVHCYADDSTGDAQYISHQCLSRSVVQERRSKLASEVENSLGRISEGESNLVQFNPLETQVYAFTAKKNTFVVVPQFQEVSLKPSTSIGILGVDISSNVQFRSNLEANSEA